LSRSRVEEELVVEEAADKPRLWRFETVDEIDCVS
jgi:hypothetical protein